MFSSRQGTIDLYLPCVASSSIAFPPVLAVFRRHQVWWALFCNTLVGFSRERGRL